MFDHFALWIALLRLLKVPGSQSRTTARQRMLQSAQPPGEKAAQMSDENQSQPKPALGRHAMAAIGRELRLMNDDIVAEGVPERFAEILRKLDEPGNEGETR